MPFEKTMNAPICVGLDVGSEIDFARLHAGFDIAGRVESFSGDDISKFV
jgi:hypothetical protein